jgi:hypothetical protein
MGQDPPNLLLYANRAEEIWSQPLRDPSDWFKPPGGQGERAPGEPCPAHFVSGKGPPGDNRPNL